MKVTHNDHLPTENDSLRLIAFSIIILSGAIALGFGSVAERGDDASGFGLFLVLAGGALTGGELYLTGFFQELREAFFAKSGKGRSSDANNDTSEPPPTPTD